MVKIAGCAGNKLSVASATFSIRAVELLPSTSIRWKYADPPDAVRYSRLAVMVSKEVGISVSEAFWLLRVTLTDSGLSGDSESRAPSLSRMTKLALYLYAPVSPVPDPAAIVGGCSGGLSVKGLTIPSGSMTRFMVGLLTITVH